MIKCEKDSSSYGTLVIFIASFARSSVVAHTRMKTMHALSTEGHADPAQNQGLKCVASGSDRLLWQPHNPLLLLLVRKSIWMISLAKALRSHLLLSLPRSLESLQRQWIRSLQ